MTFDEWYDARLQEEASSVVEIAPSAASPKKQAPSEKKDVNSTPHLPKIKNCVLVKVMLDDKEHEVFRTPQSLAAISLQPLKASRRLKGRRHGLALSIAQRGER